LLGLKPTAVRGGEVFTADCVQVHEVLDHVGVAGAFGDGVDAGFHGGVVSVGVAHYVEQLVAQVVAGGGQEVPLLLGFFAGEHDVVPFGLGLGRGVYSHGQVLHQAPVEPGGGEVGFVGVAPFVKVAGLLKIGVHGHRGKLENEWDGPNTFP